jgi:hypothetical protein
LEAPIAKNFLAAGENRAFLDEAAAFLWFKFTNERSALSCNECHQWLFTFALETRAGTSGVSPEAGIEWSNRERNS